MRAVHGSVLLVADPHQLAALLFPPAPAHRSCAAVMSATVRCSAPTTHRSGRARLSMEAAVEKSALASRCHSASSTC